MPVHPVQSVIVRVQLILVAIQILSEDDTEEPDHTPLTKADIPSIVNAVLSNISTEGNSSRDDSQDVSHLGE